MFYGNLHHLWQTHNDASSHQIAYLRPLKYHKTAGEINYHRRALYSNGCCEE